MTVKPASGAAGDVVRGRTTYEEIPDCVTAHGLDDATRRFRFTVADGTNTPRLAPTAGQEGVAQNRQQDDRGDMLYEARAHVMHV